jgi:hypothetical protein
VRFRISTHSGHGAPPDAIDRLAARLGSSVDDAFFTRVGNEILATWGEDAPVAMERDEREELGRLALLEIVGEACDDEPGLRVDWFAVSPRPN